MSPLDQLAVHDGDLPGWATKGDEAEPQPEAERFREGDATRFNLVFFVCPGRGYGFFLYSYHPSP